MNFSSANGMNYDNITYQNFYSKKVENFENLQNISTTSSLTDNSFKCSDSYEIVGETINNYSNSSEEYCKTNCLDNKDCIGFNFNKQDKSCKTFSNGTSLNNPNNSNTFCIKTNLSGSKCQLPEASIPMPEMTEMTGMTGITEMTEPDKLTGLKKYFYNQRKGSSASSNPSTSPSPSPMISKNQNDNACAFQKLDLIYDFIEKNPIIKTSIPQNNFIDNVPNRIPQISASTLNSIGSNNTNNQTDIQQTDIQQTDIQQTESEMEYKTESEMEYKTESEMEYQEQNEIDEQDELEDNKQINKKFVTNNIKQMVVDNAKDIKQDVKQVVKSNQNVLNQMIPHKKLNKKEHFELNQFDWFSSDLIKLVIIILLLYFIIFLNCGKMDKNKN